MSSITVRLGCRIAAFLLLMGCSGSAENSQNQATARTDAKPAAQNSTQQTGTATMPATAGGSTKPVSTGDLSGFLVVINTEDELMLTGPGGHRTGRDINNNESLNEIPNSSYADEYIEDPEGEAGMSTRQLEIGSPSDGGYYLTVTGAGQHDYNLNIRLYDARAEPFSWSQTRIPILKGAVHSFGITYHKTGPEKSSIKGGFEGAAQPGESNGLLTYGTVSDSVTTLPAGTTSFGLLIFYAPTVMGDMFSATLDDADISNLFKPVAGKHEIVIIPLHTGRNVLRLGAMGATETDKTLDEDVLEFVVE